MLKNILTQNTLLIGYQKNWYNILTLGFMHNALIGGTLVALAAGLVGYFVVLRNSIFAAHALSHIGIPGATGAALIGMSGSIGFGVFCIFGALIIGLLDIEFNNYEITTSILLTLSTGFGLLFNTLARKNSSLLINMLFGNLLSINEEELLMFSMMLVVLTATILLIYRPLLFSSINSEVANAKGVPVRVFSILFMIILGATVSMTVLFIGTLLLFALMVTPAATAIIITNRPVIAIVMSIIINIMSVWFGLLISVIFNFPPSFAIVLLACTFWVIVQLVSWVKNIYIVKLLKHFSLKIH